MPEYSRVEAVLSMWNLHFGNMNRFCLARIRQEVKGQLGWLISDVRDRTGLFDCDRDDIAFTFDLLLYRYDMTLV